MGLDQYAYRAAQAGQYEKFYSSAEYDPDTDTFVSAGHQKPEELAYWRKHHNLHGWMKRLYQERHDPAGAHSFNGIELELTRDDLKRLREDVLNNRLPDTNGPFFGYGQGADQHYRDYDLEFIKNALADDFLGYKIFYNSSW